MADIDPAVQTVLWLLVDQLCDHGAVEADYLQVFDLSALDDPISGCHNELVEHRQEVPEYRASYRMRTDKPFTGCVFVIDDGTHATMLLDSEY
ncbi:MAG: DUF960 family protein [Bacilli bacterium]